MDIALHITTRVLTGGKVEISAPELIEGDAIDVFVVPRKAPVPQHALMDFLDSLPEGPRSAKSWDEVDRHFQQERDSWDR